MEKRYTPTKEVNKTTKEVNKTTKEVNTTTKEVNKPHKDDGIKCCKKALVEAEKQVLSNNLEKALAKLTTVQTDYKKELEGFPGLKLKLEQLRQECADVSVHERYRSFCSSRT